MFRRNILKYYQLREVICFLNVFLFSITAEPPINKTACSGEQSSKHRFFKAILPFLYRAVSVVLLISDSKWKPRLLKKFLVFSPYTRTPVSRTSLKNYYLKSISSIFSSASPHEVHHLPGNTLSVHITP